MQQVQNIDELFDAGPFQIESPEDFAAVPDDEWDVFVKGNTSYESWEAMQEEAVEEWTSKKLGI